MKDSYRNPFDGINASQLNDKAILEYWCNPFSYKLFSDLKEEDIFVGQLNTIIVGGRSSGKTMLLRYSSFNVQYQKAINELNGKESIIKYFIDKGGIGIYKRIDGSALNDFNSKNIPEDKKNGLFTHYFNDYDKFIIDVCKKRLENVQVFRDSNKTNIISFLGLREDLVTEALALTEKYPARHFAYKKFKGINKTELNKLKNPDNPLLEMLNLLWVTRGVPINDISKAMRDYVTGKNTSLSKKYKMDYVDKYKLSLMFLLASVYKKHKLYYSFRTFSFLSFGMIGHFLELCNEAFKYGAFEDREKLIQDGIISKEAQNKAAFEVSSYQLRKTSSIPYYGNLIYQFINNIGNIFQSYHLDSKIKYPETNQFSVDYLLIKDEKYKEAFRHAIRWSVIQKKKSKQRPSPSKNKTDIFAINRIFSPVFGITYRTRGGYSYELSPEEIIRYMTEKIEPDREISVRRKRKATNKLSSNQSSTQQKLPF